MSINEALRLRAQDAKANIGLCHECLRSGVLVKHNAAAKMPLCAECADHASRRFS